MNPCFTPVCVLEERAESIAAGAAESAAEAVTMAIATPLVDALRQIFLLLFSWLLVPATDLVGRCSPWLDSGAVECAVGPSEQLRRWMVPVTGLVLFGGLLWQGLVATVTRKGQSLLQAGKGLVAAAVWGVVGIAGTQLALRAGDQYACWVIGRALGVEGGSCDPAGIANGLLVSDAVESLAQMLLFTHINAPILLIVFGLVVLLIVLVQILLMIFREASIVILAGLLQMAAAGTVSRGTSGWFQKVLSWMLTLVAYKPVVATVYATAFLMLGGSDDGTLIRHAGAAAGGDVDGATELRWIVMGLAVLVMSIVALPAMMKFFSWTVGTERHSGGGGQALAGAAMSAMYASGAMRSGGSSAADQARATEQSMPTPAGGSNATGSGVPAGSPPLPAGGGGAGAAGGAGAGAGAGAAGAAGGAGAAAGAAGGPVGLAAMAVVQGAQQVSNRVRQQGSSAMETGG